ncbi:hypothetical protein QBC32DRAFT_344814 [Pseudoneurospora amorphoporcata]|uniref:Uncharacterized protein n=1 Tax=Pseudoneurospora amorphoporcata TaxID=241081 RepID=A0AAN6NSC5_9PEZI|nr:hypothetical protein QBC32DRAFT_344814 [Pseudoneurospora amorphoporcata]
MVCKTSMRWKKILNKESLVSRPDTRGETDELLYRILEVGQCGVKRGRDTRMARHYYQDGNRVSAPITTKAGRWSRGGCVSPS